MVIDLIRQLRYASGEEDEGVNTRDTDSEEESTPNRCSTCIWTWKQDFQFLQSVYLKEDQSNTEMVALGFFGSFQQGKVAR